MDLLDLRTELLQWLASVAEHTTPPASTVLLFPGDTSDQTAQRPLVELRLVGLNSSRAVGVFSGTARLELVVKDVHNSLEEAGLAPWQWANHILHCLASAQQRSTTRFDLLSLTSQRLPTNETTVTATLSLPVTF